MNEAFVSADTWAKSAIQKKWFNLSEGEYFEAQIFDKNLFLVGTVTFANNEILEASLSLGHRVYYMQFREFLSENNFQIKIKKSQQSIYELLRKNNGKLEKDATIELHDYFNQVKKQRMRLSARSTQQRIETSKHGKPHTTTAKTRNTQHKIVQEQMNPAKTKKKPYHNTNRAQPDKREQKLQKNLASIAEKELITSVDKYLKMNTLPISTQKARILDPKADKSSIDHSSPPMIDIVVLQAQAHNYKERMILTRLLHDILTGELDKNPRALELKKKIFEQCGIDNETNIKIQLSTMNHGYSTLYEI